jgi:cytidylate kinase
MAASAVSALPSVRQYLFHLQQDTARKQNVIMDGRDIGTVVLPFARVKLFLTASAEDRARRRFLELQEKGVDTTFEDVLRDMKERDYNDSHRAAAPLKAAEDAILLDTSGNTLEQSVALLKETILKSLEEH